MPKSPVLISRQAIKRSLKTKIRLIGAENKILMDTINGYIKNAENVYAKIETATEITPRQFAKAMDKLETAYSACVKLILMATELFDQEDKTESVSEISTKASCSLVSGTTPESGSSTPLELRTSVIEKETHRRLKKLEHRFHDYVARKEKLNSQVKDGQSKDGEHAHNPIAVRQYRPLPTRFSNLTRPDVSGDLDNFIEFQRFLYGVDKDEGNSEKKIVTLTDQMAHVDPSQAVKAGVEKSNQDEPKKKEDDPSSQGIVFQESPSLQTDIMSKLDKLEKAIKGLAKHPSNNDILADAGHKRHSSHRDEEHAIKPELEFGSKLDSKYIARNSEAYSGLNGTQKSLARKLQKDDPSDASSASNIHNSRSVSRKASWDGGRPYYNKRTDHSDGCRKVLANLSGKYPDAKHAHCSCHHTTSEEPPNLLSQYHSKIQQKLSRHSVPDAMSRTEGLPMKSSPDSLFGEDTHLDRDGGLRDKEEMVSRVLEMINAQLFPRFRGQTPRSLSRPASPEPEEDPNKDARNHRRSRSLSTPSVKWSDARPPQVPSPTAARDREHHSPSHGFKPDNYSPQGTATQLEDCYNVIHTQIFNLASQMFHSIANDQVNQLLASGMKCNGQSFHSLHQQLLDLRQALEDMARKQTMPRFHQCEYCQLLGDPHQSATEQQTKPSAQLQSFQTSHQAFELPHGTKGQSGKLHAPDPVTIEIHDYQGYPSFGNAGNPDLFADKRYYEQMEEEKNQIRKHAKQQMLQHRLLQKSNYHLQFKDHEGMSKTDDQIYDCGGLVKDAPIFDPVDKRDPVEVVDGKFDGPAHEKNDRLTNESLLQRHVRFNYAYPQHDSPFLFDHAEHEARFSPLPQRTEKPSNLARCTTPTPIVQCQQNSLAAMGSKVNPQGQPEAAGFTSNEKTPNEAGTKVLEHGAKGGQNNFDSQNVGGKDEDILNHSVNHVQTEVKKHRSLAGESKTVCISNLPLNMEEVKLLYLLKPHGHVTKIYFIKHRNTGAFQGIAYIKFSKEEDAKMAAKALHKMEVDGHTVCARIHSQ